MTPEEREELRRLAEKAPAGPWVADSSRASTCVNSECEHVALANLGLGKERCDQTAVFIAASREAIPALLADLDAKDAEIERLRLVESRCASIVRWLEANQSDVFRRGLWDAINKSDTTFIVGLNK